MKAGEAFSVLLAHVHVPCTWSERSVWSLKQHVCLSHLLCTLFLLPCCSLDRGTDLSARVRDEGQQPFPVCTHLLVCCQRAAVVGS